MSFELDNQTKNDLEIFRSGGGKSVFELFNLCISYGGRRLLNKIMLEPSSDRQFLKNRIDTIAYFHARPALAETLDTDKNSLDFIEHYLNYYDYPTRKPSKIRAIEKAIAYKIVPNNHYYIVERGIDYTIEMLNIIHDFFANLDGETLPCYLKETREKVLSTFIQSDFKAILAIKNLRKLKAAETSGFDYLFRYTAKFQIRYFLDLMYYLDVVIAAAKVARKNGFSFPQILPAEEKTIEASLLFHPLVKNCIGNDLIMSPENNLLFVSGPNMSGKSTFLKSLGLAAYLAHIGFPVAAISFRISLLSGICSTINLKDDLNNSYSHFYSEVKRIKNIAVELQKEKNKLVIFDELFRGTNVKDAHDGSLAVISAFAETGSSFYVISTHILEVAEQLHNKNIKFVFLETLNENGTPCYTYMLKNGISDERLGMHIIEKEKVIETINTIKS